jgi:hypothetical protein
MKTRIAALVAIAFAIAPSLAGAHDNIVVDEWLRTNTTCPLCRAAALSGSIVGVAKDPSGACGGQLDLVG